MNMKKQNLIYIFADQLRWSSLGCHGDVKAQTPNIDTFAQQSLDLDNAVKYSPEGSRIRISMDRWINFLHICVEDEGIGIPKEEQHKVFQRFYRGGAREVRCQQGSGIGLFLTREIINRHCGTIKVISGGRRKQKGSLFQIQLPVTST